MSDLSIRQAELNDVPALAECFDIAYAPFKSKIPDLPNVSAGMSSAIEDKSVWVAEINATVVGGIVLDPNDEYLILENVAVHPSASGSGVGKALIGCAESECLRLGLHEVRLSTHKEMKENVSLYQHLGWRVVSVEGNKVNMSKSAQDFK